MKAFRLKHLGGLKEHERIELMRCACNARDGNLNAFDDIPEINDKMTASRLGNWLFNLYRDDILKLNLKNDFPPVTIRADRSTAEAFRKVYEYNNKLCDRITDIPVYDRSQLNVKTWQEYGMFIVGQVFLISQSTLLLEDVLFMPGLIDNFRLSSSLGMIHIPSRDTALLHITPVRHTGIFPHGIGANEKLNFDYMKTVLKNNRWDVIELKWPDYPG